jgi:hypothetical protein
MVFRIHRPDAARAPAYRAVRLIPVIPRRVARKTVKEKPVALRRRLRTIREKATDPAAVSSSPPLAKWAENNGDSAGISRGLLLLLIILLILLLILLLLVFGRDDRVEDSATQEDPGC